MKNLGGEKFNKERITCLGLRGLRLIEFDNLFSGLVEKSLDQVVKLVLKGCLKLSEKTIEFVAQKCTDLMFLDVSGCGQIQNLVGKFPSLETLNAENCGEMVNVQIQANHLRESLFDGCVKLKSVKVEQLKRVLEVLSFLDCEEIEVEDLAKFFII